jgi:heme exporter protein D
VENKRVTTMVELPIEYVVMHKRHLATVAKKKLRKKRKTQRLARNRGR